MPLSRSTKKQRVATPFPALHADTMVYVHQACCCTFIPMFVVRIPAPACDNDEESAKITPRRLYVTITCCHSTFHSTFFFRCKPVQLTKAASAKKSTSTAVMYAHLLYVLLHCTQQSRFSGKKTSNALLKEAAEAAGDSSDELHETSPGIILCDKL